MAIEHEPKYKILRHHYLANASHLFPKSCVTTALPPPPPPRPRLMSRTLILCLQFPIVTTALWGQLGSKTMTVLPRSVIILHCHGYLCLSNTNVSSALWRQCKSKITAHLPGYPRPAQGHGRISGYK